MKKTKQENISDSFDALRDLRALEEIEKNPGISQRALSNRLGVALGITNSLIKMLVRKGLVKIKGKNNRSLTYHLTHAGVLHKSRLAIHWTLNTIKNYQRMRREVAIKLAELAESGKRQVVIYGDNELAEVVSIIAAEVGLEILGVLPGSEQNVTKSVNSRVISSSDLKNLSPDAILACVDQRNPLEKQSTNTPIINLFE
jgi:DNA-binding MarR family transcriptional regulator